MTTIIPGEDGTPKARFKCIERKEVWGRKTVLRTYEVRLGDNDEAEGLVYQCLETWHRKSGRIITRTFEQVAWKWKSAKVQSQPSHWRRDSHYNTRKGAVVGLLTAIERAQETEDK